MGGVFGSLIGLAVGLVTAVGNYYGIRAVHKGYCRWAARYKEQQRSIKRHGCIYGLLVMAVYLWMVISSLLGFFIIKSIVRLCLNAGDEVREAMPHLAPNTSP